MAHQDYVSRPPKRRQPKKSAPPQPLISTNIKLLSVVVVAAIAAFSYFLWSIKDVEPSTTIPAKTTKHANKNEVELPEPPKEKWGYMEDLKNKEVEVGEYEVEQKGPYAMFCGSFKTADRAETLKAQIAFAGISSQIREKKGSTGTWHQVILGPYERKRLAEKDKHQLARNNVTGCQIWLWR